MSEDLKSKVIDTIDSLIPKGQNSLDLRTTDMVYGISRAKEAVLKLFNAESTQTNAESTQDCISRQAVLEAIDEIESEVADGDGFQYDKWRQYFCDLPSADTGSYRLWKLAYERGKAEAEPKWIPVTERLPDDGGDVLITFCGEEETRIVPVNYYQKIWFDCIFDIELNPNGVIAWMPLPEPWEGGAE